MHEKIYLIRMKANQYVWTEDRSWALADGVAPEDITPYQRADLAEKKATVEAVPPKMVLNFSKAAAKKVQRISSDLRYIKGAQIGIIITVCFNLFLTLMKG